MPAYLKIGKGSEARTFSLEEEVTTIGRSKGCVLTLPHPHISRQHARILCRNGSYILEECGSKYGTAVNGTPVQEPVELQDRDQIAIGAQLLQFMSAPLEPVLALDPSAPGGQHILTSVDATPALDRMVEVAPSQKLRAVLNTLRELSGSVKRGPLLDRVLECLFQVFPQATHGVILLREEGQAHSLRPVAARSRSRRDRARIRLSVTVAERSLQERRAILSADAMQDEDFKESLSVPGYGIRSLICAPILGQEGRPLGVIQVHANDLARTFSEEDLEILVSVALTSAMALENLYLHREQAAAEQLRRELLLAREVQKGFLPANDPNVPGYEFYSYYESAHTVGGDYYGYTPLPDGRLAIAIGDVSGKGIPAALLMARLTSDLRFALLSENEPGTILQAVHRSLHEAGIEDHFVTLLLAILEPHTHELALASAGHLPPLLCEADGTVSSVGADQAGLPLLTWPEAEIEYASVRLTLAPGSSLVAFTDGLVEAANEENEELGLANIRACLANADSRPSRRGQDLIDLLQAHSAGQPQHDDTTLLCFGRGGR